METKDIIIENYDAKKYQDAIKNFDCGNFNLNNFLKFADEIGTTFLFVESATGAVVGYISFACGGLKLDKYVSPAIEVKLFAVDKKYQSKIDKESNRTYAYFYFRSFIEYFRSISRDTIKADYVILHSLDDKSTHFYEKFDFKKFSNKDDQKKVLVGNFEIDCTPMYFAID